MKANPDPLEEDINNSELSLNDMPTEIMANIMSYLTFKDTCRLKRTNTRMWDLAMILEFWQSITIPSQALTSTLVNTIIAMAPNSSTFHDAHSAETGLKSLACKTS